MSVQKSFRLNEFANAILEILSEREGKTQTAILEELIKGHVIWDKEREEGLEIMREADRRLNGLKAKLEEENH